MADTAAAAQAAAGHGCFRGGRSRVCERPALRTTCSPGLQHDDGIKDVTYEAMRAVTDGRQSLNGCPAVATMFTTSALTGTLPAPCPN